MSLHKLYEHFRNTNPDSKVLPDIDPHWLVYTRCALEQMFPDREFTNESVFQLLWSEGMLPDKYYFSDWFIKKYIK